MRLAHPGPHISSYFSYHSGIQQRDSSMMICGAKDTQNLIGAAYDALTESSR